MEENYSENSLVYFYNDIVSIETQKSQIEFGIVSKAKMFKKVLQSFGKVRVYSTFLILTTSAGTSLKLSLPDDKYIWSSVNGMKQYIMLKKKR